MGLLDGKTGLVLNIANDRSIATHIAANCIRQGARCGFGFLPMDNIEKSQRRVKKAMEENGFGDAWLFPCDVGSDESIEKFFAAARDQFGTIDFLVHSLAFANRDYLKKDDGNFLSTPRDVFRQALVPSLEAETVADVEQCLDDLERSPQLVQVRKVLEWRFECWFV